MFFLWDWTWACSSSSSSRHECNETHWRGMRSSNPHTYNAHLSYLSYVQRWQLSHKVSNSNCNGIFCPHFWRIL
jgi:hypothetical protein